MLPVADYFMFDQRIVRYNFTAGDGAGLGVYEHVTDPRAILPVIGTFEMLWERRQGDEQVGRQQHQRLRSPLRAGTQLDLDVMAARDLGDHQQPDK